MLKQISKSWPKSIYAKPIRYHSTTSQKRQVAPQSIFNTPYEALLTPQSYPNTSGLDWQAMAAAESNQLLRLFDSVSEEPQNNATESHRKIFSEVLDQAMEQDSKDALISLILEDVNRKVHMDNACLGVQISSAQTKAITEALSRASAYINALPTDEAVLEHAHSLQHAYKLISLNNPSSAVSRTKTLCQRRSAENAPVNQLTVGFLVHLCMKSLYENFGSPATAISDILSWYREIQVARNRDFYFYGCSTEVYNFLIKKTWHHFQDVKMVHLLVSDLRMKGGHGDAETVETVKKICAQARLLQLNQDPAKPDWMSFEYQTEEKLEAYSSFEDQEVSQLEKLMMTLAGLQIKMVDFTR